MTTVATAASRTRTECKYSKNQHQAAKSKHQLHASVPTDVPANRIPHHSSDQLQVMVANRLKPPIWMIPSSQSPTHLLKDMASDLALENVFTIQTVIDLLGFAKVKTYDERSMDKDVAAMKEDKRRRLKEEESMRRARKAPALDPDYFSVADRIAYFKIIRIIPSRERARSLGSPKSPNARRSSGKKPPQLTRYESCPTPSQTSESGDHSPMHVSLPSSTPDRTDGVYRKSSATRYSPPPPLTELDAARFPDAVVVVIKPTTSSSTIVEPERREALSLVHQDLGNPEPQANGSSTTHPTKIALVGLTGLKGRRTPVTLKRSQSVIV